MGEVEYTFIRKHTKKYTVKLLCSLLKVSRQGYYDWLKRRKSNRAIDSEILIDDIRKIIPSSKGVMAVRGSRWNFAAEVSSRVKTEWHGTCNKLD